MFLVYTGLYVLFLAIVWGFFVVARIHSYNFKNFSNNIVKVTNILFFILIFLSILGGILIFFLNSGDSSFKVNIDTNTKQESYY